MIPAGWWLLSIENAPISINEPFYDQLRSDLLFFNTRAAHAARTRVFSTFAVLLYSRAHVLRDSDSNSR